MSGSRWRGKRSRHSRRMRNPQFYVSDKRPMQVYNSPHQIICRNVWRNRRGLVHDRLPRYRQWTRWRSCREILPAKYTQAKCHPLSIWIPTSISIYLECRRVSVLFIGIFSFCDKLGAPNYTLPLEVLGFINILPVDHGYIHNWRT